MPRSRPSRDLGGQYDLLYFDANHDMDLANDAVVHLLKEPPKAVARWLGNAEQHSRLRRRFRSLGEGRPLRVLPVFGTTGDGAWCTSWRLPAWQGEIRLGKKAYKAMLSQPDGALGGFDRPSSPLILSPVDGPKQPQSYLSMSTLGAIRDANGEFYISLGLAQRRPPLRPALFRRVRRA